MCQHCLEKTLFLKAENTGGIVPLCFSAYPVPPYTNPPPWLMPFPFSSQNPTLDPIPMLPDTSHMLEGLSFILSGVCGMSHLISLDMLPTSPCLLPSRAGNTNPGPHKSRVSAGDGAHRETQGWQPPCVNSGSSSPCMVPLQAPQPQH